jgi:hypothetical protein
VYSVGTLGLTYVMSLKKALMRVSSSTPKEYRRRSRSGYLLVRSIVEIIHLQVQGDGTIDMIE